MKGLTTIFLFAFTGTGVNLHGWARPDGGYTQVDVLDKNGNVVVKSIVDMYCLYPVGTLKFVSPTLPEDTYTLIVRVMGERGNWSDKRRSNYGSTGYGVAVHFLRIENNNSRKDVR